MVAGLGNPGRRYERTRHNAGFIVVDRIAERLGAELRTKDGARTAHVAAERVVLVEPQSFMNDSGIPIGKLAAWWKAAPEAVLVVSDDLDLPFGRLRMRASGGSGGHNGLKSIIQHLGEGFPRLRVGIGRSPTGEGDEAGAAVAAGAEIPSDAIVHVLAKFTKAEERELVAIVDAAADAALRWLAEGPVAAMNVVNARRA